MIDLIYNFILNTFIGNVSFQGAEELAILLTYTTLLLIFFVLIRLVRWSLGIFRFKRYR